MFRSVAALVLAVAPLSAAAEATDPATPAQDLDCAIWASMMAGATTDKDVQVGFVSVLGYFIGRYEASAANDIDEAMLARTPQIAATDLTSLQGACQARMGRFGQRLISLGRRMEALGRALETH